MSEKFVGGEHVGFLSFPDNSASDGRLDMMGGELCINALRSAATLLGIERNKQIIRLESSGTDEIFDCRVVGSGKKRNSSIAFSLCPLITYLESGVSIVRLDGIAHILIEYPKDVDIENPESIFVTISEKFAQELTLFPAFGIIPFQPWEDGYRIFPVVYVRSTNSLVLETGCGSGSVALAMSILDRSRSSGRIIVYQPSGSSYCLDVLMKAAGARVSLESEVELLVRGTAYLPDPIGRIG